MVELTREEYDWMMGYILDYSERLDKDEMPNDDYNYELAKLIVRLEKAGKNE